MTHFLSHELPPLPPPSSSLRHTFKELFEQNLLQKMQLISNQLLIPHELLHSYIKFSRKRPFEPVEEKLAAHFAGNFPKMDANS